MKNIIIDGHTIGQHHPPFIIAELSANHNGSIERAFETIEMAKRAGAHAVKIQSYTPDTMTIDSSQPDFQIQGGLWDGYNLYQLYQLAHTPWDWHEALFQKAKALGMTLFSTPFDETAVDLLEDLNTPAYKIASFELTDLPLIQYVASTKKPMIMSTGMANVEEIEEAVETAKMHGCEDLILLHCISAYPAPVAESHLQTIADMIQRYACLTGLSDHTLGTTAAITAIGLGARVIEKHVTLDRQDKGPDSAFSLEPDELQKLCAETAAAFSALGTVNYETKSAEKENFKFRRSIYFVMDKKCGERIVSTDIRRIRPGFGLPPRYFNDLIGKTVNQDVSAGTAVTWDVIDDH